MADNDKLLELMRQRFKEADSAYAETRKNSLDDLKFFAGDSDNKFQWPNEVLSTRKERPSLTINKLPQHVRQISNDQRQNRPAGKVIPVDDKGDIEVAKIFDGIVRHIEYISDADVCIDTACECQVIGGEGFFRLITDYCDDNSFEQEIKYKRIRNPFSILIDPTCQDSCGEDAQFAFVPDVISKDKYHAEYPDAMPISSIENAGHGDPLLPNWVTKDSIRIVEYFYVDYEKKTLELFANGEAYFDDSDEAKSLKDAGLQPIKTRAVKAKKVKWIKSNGYEVLEEGEWPGNWIPIIRVVGDELEIDGELIFKGIVRNAKDPQRLYNYWASQEAEMLALSPKAPFIGYAGQFEGYERDWKSANTENLPYLEVNPDVMDGNGTPMPLPQRAMPPMAQSGLIQAKAGANDDIKSTTGQYDASIGAEANEKSGKAILAREKQTDTGTFHYVDNLARAVRFATRQIVDLIPKIYDTPRIARIIGLDGETDHVKLNPDQQEPMKKVVDPETNAVIERIYNLSIGKYDVCVTTGPSYMTKRQETAEMMINLSQGTNDPALGLLMRYFAIKNADFPDAQDFANIMKKMLPQGLLDDTEDSSPELVKAKQQIQQMGQQMQQMQQMLQNVSKSFEEQELRIKEYDAETRRISAVQSGLSEEQIQDIVLGTIHGMQTNGDLIGNMPTRQTGDNDGDEMQPMQG